MNILPKSLGVFWTRPGWSTAHHADLHLLPGETHTQALDRYRRAFPQDVIIGVKDRSGRWVA